MGKIFVFCRIKLKFCSWLYKKRWYTSWKFQLEITSNKKVIAKKPLTNLLEMNSNFISEWFSSSRYQFLHNFPSIYRKITFCSMLKPMFSVHNISFFCSQLRVKTTLNFHNLRVTGPIHKWRKISLSHILVFALCFVKY